MIDMSEKYKNEEYLYEEYIVKGRSTVEISNDFDVASSTINYWLKKNNIETRSISEATEGREISKQQREDISKTLTGKMTGEDHPFYGESHSEQTKQKLSEQKKGGNHPLYGKERPDFAEKMSGSGNPSWKGGLNKEKDFRKQSKWQKFSDKVRELAGWQCEHCGTHGSEARELQTHHAYPVSRGGDEWQNVFIVLYHDCHISEYEFWHTSTVEEQVQKVGGEPSLDARGCKY